MATRKETEKTAMKCTYRSAIRLFFRLSFRMICAGDFAVLLGSLRLTEGVPEAARFAEAVRDLEAECFREAVRVVEAERAFKVERSLEAGRSLERVVEAECFRKLFSFCLGFCLETSFW